MPEKTKIVATVGPACNTEEKLIRLIKAGADVFRINASHSTPATIRSWVQLIRRASVSAEKLVAVLVDLQGPRIRTGKLKNSKPVQLQKGEFVLLEQGTKPGDEKTIRTSYPGFMKLVRLGSRILLDNGFIELEVKGVEKNGVKCLILAGGMLGENKGINIPDADVGGEPLTSKDIQDLRTALQCRADYIALSFVRSGKDVAIVKNWIKKHGKPIPVIAKIEKPEAVKNIDVILDIADGIMVARGDLGIEMGVERVPVVQKKIIDMANVKKIPVITATQMMESMIEHPRPTRAEASDVANAIFDGTDAVMLSGETAVGKYPVEAVKVMAQVIEQAERYRSHNHDAGIFNAEEVSPIHAIAHAARDAAHQLRARALIVYTVSGKSVLLISKLKPECKIIAATTSKEVCSRLSLFHGVTPLLISSSKALIRTTDQAILKSKLLEIGDLTVLVSGKHALPEAQYMLKVHKIGETFTHIAPFKS